MPRSDLHDRLVLRAGDIQPVPRGDGVTGGITARDVTRTIRATGETVAHLSPADSRTD